MEEKKLSEEISKRRDDLFHAIKTLDIGRSIGVSTDRTAVTVHHLGSLICGINVEEEVYKIYHVSSDWTDQTSYLCQKSGDGTWHYYLETIDECSGEVQRLVEFELQKLTHDLRPELIHIQNYGNDSKAFCLNAADWFDEKKRVDQITYILASRGISKQNIITPGLCMLHRYVGISATKVPEPVTFFYQIEIKTVHNKGTAVFKLVCHQTPNMGERVTDFFKNTILPKMGRQYRYDGTWYDKRFGSMKLKLDTTGTDIYDFLDENLVAAERFEDELFSYIGIER